MAQAPGSTAGIEPWARPTTTHTGQRQKGSLFTGGLPARPLDVPLRAGPRRLLWQGDRGRGAGGRRIPYALPLPSPEGALMAGIVLPSLGCLLVATLRFPAPLTPSYIATAPRAVAVPPVAAAADGKRPLTAPAGPGMKDGNFARRHDGPSAEGASGHRLPRCARLAVVGWPPAPQRAAEQPESPGVEPGLSFLRPQRGQLIAAMPPTRRSPPAPDRRRRRRAAAERSPPPRPPPRFARDDGAGREVPRPTGPVFYGSW
jgi:hypothetical protein